MADLLGDVLASEVEGEATGGAGYTTVDEAIEDIPGHEYTYGTAAADEEDDEEDAAVLKFGKGGVVRAPLVRPVWLW